MNVYVFTGPSLSSQEAAAELDAIYLPPVSQGDIIRVTLKQPQAIGIIDGYFERIPAVWHKEILWAMSQGVHVFGSASMGALRAAELTPFGMEGVGLIYEAYHNGELEDDDEVAVAHGPDETNYLAMSEAMVNIRFTLAKAESEGVCSSATCSELCCIAKDLFYPNRIYPLILKMGAERGLPAGELQTLREWLSSGQVNQKKEDAINMLRVMRKHLENNPKPKRVKFTFEHTEWWDRAKRFAGQIHMDLRSEAETMMLDTLLDELRLDCEGHARAREGAMLRCLALEEARRQGHEISANMLQETMDAFRRERDLLEPAEVEQWIQTQHISRDQFIQLVEQHALLQWVSKAMEPEIISHIADYLRVNGDYIRLAQRAGEKQRMLESQGLLNQSVADLGLTEEELIQWYFEDCVGRDVPLDTSRYAKAIGFTDLEAFNRAVLREYCFLQGGRRTEELKSLAIERNA